MQGRGGGNLTVETFRYRRGRLYCEGVALEALAKRFGTPLFVMSAGAIRRAARSLQEAFGFLHPMMFYAVKANDSLAVLRLLAREGIGAEVVSGGELYKALRAGIRGNRIVFSGVGKSAEEIAAGLKARVMLFNVESLPELELLARVARRMGRNAPVALRINPHVDAQTHRYITTGTDENKFGIDINHALDAFAAAARMPGIALKGIHCHIGSQITSVGPYVAAARRINRLLDSLARRGIFPLYRNIGGGFGVAYSREGRRLDARALARALAPHLKVRGLQIAMEPGRYLAAEAGALLTRVLYVKQGSRKRFVIVDAGMNDLMRPCLYDAHHDIWTCQQRAGHRHTVDVVGPVCESADFLGLRRRLGPVGPGSLLAVMGVGAYGRTMSSNYNGRARAAEVMVEGRKARLIRRRESLKDLARGER